MSNVSSSGNVGIGTTSPTRKLHVVEPTSNRAANFTSLGDHPITVQSTNGTTGIQFKDNADEQAMNVEIEQVAGDFIDFSEVDPFSEGNF